MIKSYKIEVDCANCANLCEEAAKKVKGIKELGINFIMQKMEVEFEDGANEKKVLKEVYKTCRKIEPDFEIEL